MADSSTLSVVDEVVVERVAREMARRYGDGYNLDHLGAGERNRFLHEARLALTAAGMGQQGALPADWNVDSSLETWFPYTAEELKRLKEENAQLRAAQPAAAGVPVEWAERTLIPLLESVAGGSSCCMAAGDVLRELWRMLAAAPQPEARAAKCAKSIMARAIEISDANRMSGEPRNLSIVTLRMDDADTVLSELQPEPAGMDSLLGWANPIDIEKARRQRGKRKGSAIAVFVSAEQSDTYLVPLYASGQPKEEAEPIDGSGMTHGAWLAAQPDPTTVVPARPLAIAQGLINHAPDAGGEAATIMLLAAAAIKAMAADEIQKNPGFIVHMPSGTVTKA
jgi:hypothetical protein